jgi:hypothetical protein
MTYGNDGPVRYAWTGWAVLFLATAAIIMHDSSRSVIAVYRFGALQWIAGQRMYEMSGVGGFTYLPQAAILYIPFALLPPLAGEVFWRLINIGVFAFGLRGFSRLAGGRPGPDLFPLMTLVAVPLVWDCARNGQATLVMTGFMLLAVANLGRERWWRSTLWLSLAVAVKPLAVVLLLLVGAGERRMSLRVAVGAVALALMPFLTQHPVYVAHQYAEFFRNTSVSSHVAVLEQGWTTPFTALHVAGIEVSERIQTVLRVAAALATLLLYGSARRRYDGAEAAVFAFSLAALYVILFSPRTENNTYAMLGPVIGVFLAEAVLTRGRSLEGVLLGGVTLVLIGSRKLEHLLTPRAETSWLGPLLAVCIACYLLVRLFSGQGEERGAAGKVSGAS